MKKFIVAIAALMFGVAANAQVGIIAGVTSTTTDIQAAQEQLKAGDITLYHIGLTSKFDLGAIAIQPSLIYNVKGTQLSEVRTAGGEELANYKADFKTGYLELPVQLQIHDQVFLLIQIKATEFSHDPSCAFFSLYQKGKHPSNRIPDFFFP